MLAGYGARTPALALELVRRPVDLIVAVGGIPPARAAQAATATILIVFHTGGDPVAVGLDCLLIGSPEHD